MGNFAPLGGRGQERAAFVRVGERGANDVTLKDVADGAVALRLKRRRRGDRRTFRTFFDDLINAGRKNCRNWEFFPLIFAGGRLFSSEKRFGRSLAKARKALQ